MARLLSPGRLERQANTWVFAMLSSRTFCHDGAVQWPLSRSVATTHVSVEHVKDGSCDQGTTCVILWNFSYI